MILIIQYVFLKSYRVCLQRSCQNTCFHTSEVEKKKLLVMQHTIQSVCEVLTLTSQGVVFVCEVLTLTSQGVVFVCEVLTLMSQVVFVYEVLTLTSQEYCLFVRF